MTEEEKEKFVKAFKLLSELHEKHKPEAMRCKRVEVPEHLIERYNEKYGVELKNMSFTLDINAESDDTALWDLMVGLEKAPKRPLNFGDYKFRKAPETGIPKRVL